MLSLTFSLKISASGSTQATNKESIQKMISRLDEDLSTLGQISKLSETLSFPHQVLVWTNTHKQMADTCFLNLHFFFVLSLPPSLDSYTFRICLIT